MLNIWDVYMLDEGGQSKMKHNRRPFYSLEFKHFISVENDNVDSY